MAVLVWDKRKQPLMPCSEKRARLLLERNRAVVVRVHPFTIRLKDRVGGDAQAVRIKIDPGSRSTGMAMVRESSDGIQYVLWLGEIAHRGHVIRDQLAQRRAFRRRRRSNLRHRLARFNNRRRSGGWLAPSLQHRVDTTTAWIRRLRRWAPVTAVSQELVRFDMQRMENVGISGVAYQRGTLFGTEVREYLLHRHQHQCAYCHGQSGDPVLEIEHVQPRSRGGSDRVGNLVIACRDCNQAKDSRNAGEWAHALKSSARRLDQLRLRGATAVDAGKRPSLCDAAAVNSTRWSLFHALKATGLPVAAGTGGRTKWNRQRLGIPKGHALDAACVGEVEAVSGWSRPVLAIKAAGRGSYQRTRLTRHGFPRGYLMRHKQVRGFQTGDHVQAVVGAGKKAGTHTGRLAVRASGRFNIQTPAGVIQGISHRHCTLTQRADGYGYFVQSKIAATETEEARTEAA
ncbi:RNA-guided endonuclease IscB [Guyparkeria sp. 1SP6A2]|nr:RNA-guided endonuclease IscB [Guyparkeria sp. 1SP6A2]